MQLKDITQCQLCQENVAWAQLSPKIQGIKMNAWLVLCLSVRLLNYLGGKMIHFRLSALSFHFELLTLKLCVALHQWVFKV